VISFDDVDAAQLLRFAEIAAGEDRIEAMRQLLRLSGRALALGEPLPHSVTLWLAQGLSDVAAGVEPAVALGLVRRGRPSSQVTTLTRAAHVHALVAWGATKEGAADAVCTFFSLAERSHLIKAYNLAARAWEIRGPHITRLTPAEVSAGEDCRAATLADFEVGRYVAVSFAMFARFGTGSHGRSFLCQLDPAFRLHVMKSSSGLFGHGLKR
jgi:hypothetical protein